MNLGDVNLRSVSHSRPEIVTTPSQQSVTASDDYHSLSDYASNVSSIDDRATVVRWETPPLGDRPTDRSHERPLPETTVPEAVTMRNGQPSPQSPRIPESEVISEEGNISDPNPGPDNDASSGRLMRRENSPPTPMDDTPYIQYAIDQITRMPTDERSFQQDVASPFVQSPIMPPQVAEEIERQGGGQYSLDLGMENKSSPSPEIYIPVEPPKDSYRYHPLTYLPMELRPFTLIVLGVLCLAMVAAVLFSALWSRSRDGLWEYDNADSGRYFLFQYLPQLVGVLILIMLLTVESAIFRVMPFVSMASPSAKLRSAALLMDSRPSSFILPPIQFFRTGHVLIAICVNLIWLSSFSIPLLSSLLQARLTDVQGRLTWRWVIVEPVAWTLVGIYGALFIVLIASAIFFFRKRTGLKWDPSSLADIMALLPRSNSLKDYSSSETFSSKNEFKNRLQVRSDRIGYWKTRENADIFYAIGEEGAPTRTYSVEHGKVKKKDFLQGEDGLNDFDFDLEAQRTIGSPTTEGLRGNIRSPAVRYRFVPWFLRDSSVVAWTVTAIGLFVALIVVGFVRQAARRGFEPLLDATPDVVGFSSPGLLYSFVPSLIGLVLCLCWLSIDMTFRALQPFANLSGPRGVPAERSLLLDYPSRFPVAVTIKAALNGDWKVAWISFVGLLSLAFPVIGGGVFWAIYFPRDRQVRMAARMPAFYTLIGLLAVYALSFLVVWPRWRRYLPHDSITLAEIISFFHQSQILHDEPFRNPRSKTDLVTRLVGFAPGEQERPRYAFGIHRGRDGREHLGIDRWRRPGVHTLVTTERI
ncbi:MAG: hypothetical protein M1825_003753 [Sarcosagium campestre]|nr:MAG: hypothetical protein M1825_003753 [Sarcosagium campestre]